MAITNFNLTSIHLLWIMPFASIAGTFVSSLTSLPLFSYYTSFRAGLVAIVLETIVWSGFAFLFSCGMCFVSWLLVGIFVSFGGNPEYAFWIYSGGFTLAAILSSGIKIMKPNSQHIHQ
jgi:hypothetical protein